MQLALYSLLSNPFWAHNGALLDNSKSSEKGQLQAWPQRLSADFMGMKKEEEEKKKKGVRVFMCTCGFECPCMHSVKHSEDVPVSSHGVTCLCT